MQKQKEFVRQNKQKKHYELTRPLPNFSRNMEDSERAHSRRKSLLGFFVYFIRFVHLKINFKRWHCLVKIGTIIHVKSLDKGEWTTKKDKGWSLSSISPSSPTSNNWKLITNNILLSCFDILTLKIYIHSSYIIGKVVINCKIKILQLTLYLQLIVLKYWKYRIFVTSLSFFDWKITDIITSNAFIALT